MHIQKDEFERNVLASDPINKSNKKIYVSHFEATRQGNAYELVAANSYDDHTRLIN